MEKKLSRSLIIGWLILLLMLMSGCGPTNRLTDAQSTSNTNEAVSTEKSNSEPSSNDYQSFGGIDKQQLQQLAKLDFRSGDKAVVEVNGGHSTLNPKAWQLNHIIYSPLDSLNRTSSPFRGDERMARGVNLQAVSTDGSLDFNVYIYNVQPGVAFDYQTGRWKSDRSMQVR